MTAVTHSAVLAALDPEQHLVATAPRGPVCVLAGAGTGKTRALTHRIAALVLGGQVDPRHVLTLTFTARAAGELRGRLRGLGVDGVQARTFHAAALRQLRYFWPTVVGGRVPDVASTKAPLIGEAVSRLRIRADQTAVRDLAAEIEWAKVSQVGPGGYVAAARESRREAGRDGVAGLDPEMVARVYSAYEAVKSDREVIDFEDVLLLTAGMVDDDRAMARAVRDQYRCFLVDEYQDVSPVQQRLLDLWLADRDDLTVVGDANQTIYSFAGATSRFLLDFPRRFPDAPVIRLQRSYRSTPQVVDLANRLMAAPEPGGRDGPVLLTSQCPAGPAPTLIAAADDAAEVSHVVTEVSALVEQGVERRQIAVLYRVNAQSAAFEEALTEAQVPYAVRGGERFFDRREVRDAITLLRGAARATSDEATSEESLAGQVEAVLGSMGYRSTPPAGPSQARARWESLAALVDLASEIEEQPESKPGTAVDDLVARPDLTHFVEELQHRSAAAHAPSADAVTLSTLHAAKGLEWDAVFLVGLTEGMLPISYATTPEQVAEERRLLYVGITRARRHLALSYARTRRSSDRRMREPSRFLGAVATTLGSVPVAAERRPRARMAGCRGCGRALTTGAERKLGHCAQCEVDVDLALFERLREWRRQTAEAASVPAFVVFTDATLTAVAVEHPQDRRALLKIPGIGQVKVDRYGDQLLEVVRRHQSDADTPR